MGIYNGAPQMVTVFLSQQERTAIPLQPDGNCFPGALYCFIWTSRERSGTL